jgi:hypothetical protein
MEKHLGSQETSESILKYSNFSDKNLKFNVAVYLVLLGNLIFSLSASARCFDGLRRAVKNYIDPAPKELSTSEIEVPGLGVIHKSTYELAVNLGLIDRGSSRHRWYNNRKASELVSGSHFQRLLSALESQYGVPTGIKKRSLRLGKTWKELVLVLDSVLQNLQFQQNVLDLSEALGAPIDETHVLIFFENSLTPVNLIQEKQKLFDYINRIGSEGVEGLRIVLPLYNYGTLQSLDMAELTTFLLKAELQPKVFMQAWSRDFPSIPLSEIVALWPHVLAASKILRENRQFMVDPLNFLGRVHSVDSKLSNILQKFGFLPANETNGQAFVRSELRKWKQIDRKFLNPHVTQDVMKNYLNDTISNIASEIVWAFAYDASHLTKLYQSIRNLISDVMTDFIMNWTAPDSASRIIKDTLGSPEKLAAVERFLQKYGSFKSVPKEREDELLKELWLELNPKSKHLSNLTPDEIERQIRTSGFLDDLKGHVTKQEFFKDWFYQTYLQATVMVPVSMAFGATGQVIHRYSVDEDEVTFDEILTAVLFGAASNFMYYGFWAAPRYAMLYKFYPERIARVLYRKGIATTDPQYEALRAKMMSRAGLVNALAFDSVAYPAFIWGFSSMVGASTSDRPPAENK